MQVLYGKFPANHILNTLQQTIQEKNLQLSFAIIQVGNDPASSVYINFKQKKAAEIGIKSQLFKFAENISFEELKAFIINLNNDQNIHGIIVQLPLSKELLPVLQYIDTNKDIDGLTYAQQGLLIMGKASLVPCTALGVIELLKYYNISLTSKKIAVIGRSNLVGKPLAALLTMNDALVSIFHSKIDQKLFETELLNYDIICSAVGKKHFIKPYMIKQDAILIDIGVTKEDKIYGDFDPDCYHLCQKLTPNPYGIGPMTIACLLLNVYKAYILNHNL